MRMIFLIVFSLVGLLPFIGLVLLQVYLSNKPNKWLGLIIPSGLAFIFVATLILLVLLTPIARFEQFTTNGEVIESYTFDKEGERQTGPAILGFNSQTIVQTAFQLLSISIPFVGFLSIFIGIYAVIRYKKRKSKELERMNIKDL
jgi:4-amino-4-deoxy-L-arabinose transferase-like glycosyltransferase